MSEEFTYADVAQHKTKKDLHVVIWDKKPLQPGDPEPRKPAAAPSSSSSSASSGGFGVGLYALLVVGAAVAYGAYSYMNANQEK
ncbi:MAG: hypothetical protein Q9162_005449 [Coniocarpon cinnabarinum]